MNYIIGFLWFFRVAKNISFYLYLWQLKEYQISRFKAHFETKEGRVLLLNNFNLLKIILIFFSFFPLLFTFLLFLLYSAEFSKLVLDIIRRKLKLPVFTLKALFLLSISFILYLFLFIHLFEKTQFLLYLLLIDILSPIIISLLVILLQPITFIAFKKTLRKAKKKREKLKDLRVIGITGSYGKTSTKEFLYSILKTKFKVLKTPGNINSEIGISKTILKNLDSTYDFFICEMGAYKKGGIKLLSEIAKPSIGVVTGINQQHLSLFGTMENLFSAEGGEELFSSLPKEGFMIINGNSKYVSNIYKDKKVYFSLGEKPSISAENISVGESLSFDVLIGKEKFKCETNLLGEQNIENLLLAIFISYNLGISIDEIKEAVKNIEAEKGGVSFLINEEDFKVINASYSANPNSAMALINYLNTFPLKKTLVMPSLIELGASSKKIHKKIGEKISEVCDLAIITNKDYLKEIKEGAGIKKNRIIHLKDPLEIISKIKDNKGAILLHGRVNNEILNILKNDYRV